MQLIKDGHYDNDLREIDHSEVAHVPIANLKSNTGTLADTAPSEKEWAEIEDAFRALRVPLIRSAENGALNSDASFHECGGAVPFEEQRV
jgi:hypothetical protein